MGWRVGLLFCALVTDVTYGRGVDLSGFVVRCWGGGFEIGKVD